MRNEPQEKKGIYQSIGVKGGGAGLAEMMNPEGKPEVLDDILVLDLSYGNFAGIIAASFLAEFGAEVVRIEPPEGDPAREMTPFGANVKGVGIPFMFEGRNKRYMTLDIRNKPEDRQVFARLAEKAAVVIETFAPGEMDSWGIGYRQLSKENPGLIYVAHSPYGQYARQGERRGEDAGYRHYLPGGLGTARSNGRPGDGTGTL